MGSAGADPARPGVTCVQTTPLLLKGGSAVLPGGIRNCDILCEGGRVTRISDAIEAAGAGVFDAAGKTLGPGFIDVHVHGGGGHSFFTRDAARVAAYADWAPRNGVTAFLISTLGSDASATREMLEALRPVVGREGGAEPLGFHLEGPFINPLRQGAFPREMLRNPVPGEFESFQEAASGHIRQVTLAPELPGALDLIHAVRESGAVAAMGHTDATVLEARRGFEAGIRHVTHLFNAMRPIHQREGGPIVAALLDDIVTCELICDGAHVDPELLRLAYRFLGPERTVVVTDNLHIAGTSTFSGTFAGEAIEVSGAKAVRGDGTIVGSVATMDQHFRNVIQYLEVDLRKAFRMCAGNPARIAEASRKGRLEPGMDADIVVLDEGLRVEATICRGQVAWRREG
ncbi:MAG: N-acetylglucosamine-6-phosphate deacetylase [Anaerolinea sp.]|nr:N-acetylglucosamine-6-phosphate deacetylase [Anaerolinea sp.]